MNKIKENDLVRQIATDTGLTIQTTNQVIQSLKDVIIDNLRNNCQVNLIGFGSFEPFIRHKRNGVDLSNGFQPITLPEIRIAKFRTGYRMKRLLKKV
jgi:nucleoid DNA-binding protein